MGEVFSGDIIFAQPPLKAPLGPIRASRQCGGGVYPRLKAEWFTATTGVKPATTCLVLLFSVAVSPTREELDCLSEKISLRAASERIDLILFKDGKGDWGNSPLIKRFVYDMR